MTGQVHKCIELGVPRLSHHCWRSFAACTFFSTRLTWALVLQITNFTSVTVTRKCHGKLHYRDGWKTSHSLSNYLSGFHIDDWSIAQLQILCVSPLSSSRQVGLLFYLVFSYLRDILVLTHAGLCGAKNLCWQSPTAPAEEQDDVCRAFISNLEKCIWTRKCRTWT